MIERGNAKCPGAAQTAPGVTREDESHARVTLPDPSTMSGEEERTRIPGIFKRRGRYTFRYYDRQGRVRRASASTLAEAKQKRAALNTDVARGDYSPSTTQTVSSYADQWIETYAGRTRRGFREETRDDYRRILKADAKPFLGKMRLGDVRAQDIKAYIHEVSSREVRRGGVDQQVKSNTVRLSVAPVRAMFATALEEGIIRVNPCVGVRIGTARAPINEDGDENAKAFTDDELAAVIAAVPEQWRLLPDFLSETALRIGKLSPWNGETLISARERSTSGVATTAARQALLRAATGVAAFP